MAVLLQEQAEQLENSFEAPLKEFVRLVKAAKHVIADRAAALHTLHTVCPDRAPPPGALSTAALLQALTSITTVESSALLHCIRHIAHAMATGGVGAL